MTFNMDTRDDESYDGVGAGFKRLPAGRYHVEITEVDETFQKNADKLLVTFEVLAGTIPDHVGERHTEFFSVTEQAMDRVKRLAMVCGLINPGETKDVSFDQAVGTTLIIEFEPNSYESKKTGKMIETTRVGFGGFWKEDHEEVKAVPRGKRSPQPAAESSDNDGSGEEAAASTAPAADQWGEV